MKKSSVPSETKNISCKYIKFSSLWFLVPWIQNSYLKSKAPKYPDYLSVLNDQKQRKNKQTQKSFTSQFSGLSVPLEVNKMKQRLGFFIIPCLCIVSFPIFLRLKIRSSRIVWIFRQNGTTL